MTDVALTPVQLEIERKLSLPAGSLTSEQLKAWQLTKLNETLAHVRQHSPFYRQRFRGLPEKVENLEDLKLFPFTTAEDIANYGTQMVCVPQDAVERIVTLDTSGTTGKPKRLFFTRSDQQLTIDFFGVGMSTLIQPGYKVLILLPGSVPGSTGDLLQKGIAAIASVGIHQGIFTDPYAVNQRIESEQIDTLVGAPKQIFALMRAWQRAEKGACPVNSILLSTDYAAPSLMAEIEKVWDCRVLQHYGMTEAGLGVGIDCMAVRGFHLRDADMLFEIVEPHGDQVLADGKTGEVVLTTLTRQAMPLIRYRSKDLSHYIPGSCACGTVLKTLQWVRGRVDDESSLCHMPDLDDILFRLPGLNGFDASANHRSLKLDLFWNETPQGSNKATLIDEVRALLPSDAQLVVADHEGFPQSAFDLHKKRLSALK